MFPFKALIFDLDGTLIDSAPAVLDALNKTLSSLDLRAITAAELPAMMGHGARPTVARALAATRGDTSDPAVEHALARYLEFYLADPAGATVVYPGAREILESCRAEGIALGICTNKPSATTIPAMEALGLAGYFGSVRCGDAVAHAKPDGRHVHIVLDDLGVAPAEAVFIGDAAPDVLAARDAGVPVVAVDFEGDPMAARDLKADAVITHFDQLDRALMALTVDEQPGA